MNAETKERLADVSEELRSAIEIIEGTIGAMEDCHVLPATRGILARTRTLIRLAADTLDQMSTEAD